MPKQHELNALVTGKKTETEKAVTAIYQKFEKDELFSGLEKSYRPLDEAGEKLPSESKRPQLSVATSIRTASSAWGDLYDKICSQDAGNQISKADVIVDGQVLLKDVPVTTLLFLLKQVNDLVTFIGKIPTPDPAEKWVYDPNTGMLATAASETHRTKKVPKVIVKAPATAQHPAQTEMVQEDVLVGYWRTIKYSDKITADQKAELLARAHKLQEALKVAKTRANECEVTPRKIGGATMKYVFGDLAGQPG